MRRCTTTGSPCGCVGPTCTYTGGSYSDPTPQAPAAPSSEQFAWEDFQATLPASMRENIRDGERSIRSITRDAHRAGWEAAKGMYSDR